MGSILSMQGVVLAQMPTVGVLPLTSKACQVKYRKLLEEIQDIYAPLDTAIKNLTNVSKTLRTCKADKLTCTTEAFNVLQAASDLTIHEAGIIKSIYAYAQKYNFKIPATLFKGAPTLSKAFKKKVKVQGRDVNVLVMNDAQGPIPTNKIGAKLQQAKNLLFATGPIKQLKQQCPNLGKQTDTDQKKILPPGAVAGIVLASTVLGAATVGAITKLITQEKPLEASDAGEIAEEPVTDGPRKPFGPLTQKEAILQELRAKQALLETQKQAAKIQSELQEQQARLKDLREAFPTGDLTDEQRTKLQTLEDSVEETARRSAEAETAVTAAEEEYNRSRLPIVEPETIVEPVETAPVAMIE